MSGFFKIKTLLIALLVVSPAAGYWIKRGKDFIEAPPLIPTAHAAPGSPAHPPLAETTNAKIPVEIISKGSPRETVYIDVAPTSVPEPGSSLLLLLTGLAASLRRKR